MVNDSQHQDSIDLQLQRVRVDSFPLFLSSRFGYSYGLCGLFGPLHRPSRVASSCYVRPLPHTVDGNLVFVWSCHPGFVPAMTTTMHLPMVRLALDTQLTHFHQNLLVQSCPLNPLGNTEDKRKEGQGLRFGTLRHSFFFSSLVRAQSAFSSSRSLLLSFWALTRHTADFA